MQQVPLSAVPFQTFSIVLNGQNTQISVYQKNGSVDPVVYADIALDGTPIVTTHVCRNKIRLLLSAAYKGYAGDFVMIDTAGNEQPSYTGLGTRFLLFYLTPEEIGAE